MSRIKKIQDYLEANRLGAFLVLTKINRQYVSGFTGSAGVVLITKKGGQLFVDDRYLIRAKKESPLPVRRLEDLKIALVKLTSIGIEDRITLREYKWLKKLGHGFKPTKNIIENLRAVKSAEEIEYIAKAQSIIDQILTIVKIRSIVGMTENSLALKMEQLAIKYGADGMAFESIVAFGPNAAAPHHLSGSTKFRKNNFLLLDFGVLINNYHSDFTRTLFIGKPTKKQEKVYNTVREAQERAMEKVRLGEVAAVVDQTARGHIEQSGFGKYFTHNTGHGVGLEIHELPNFSSDSPDILAENMVVTVEPGIYIEKWGGVRIEDMVRVTRRGPKLLSKIPRDLKSMIIWR